MWCRVEEKNESSEGILCINVKYSLNTFYSALKRSKYKLWKIDVFKNIADKL